MRHSPAAVLLVALIALLGLAPAGSAALSGGGDSPPAGLAAAAGTCRSLLYPPYDPQVNYCGPEWLQESGHGYLVPREPVPGYDFSPACYQHDACYSECCQNGMSQAACDTQFLSNNLAICRNTTAAIHPWWSPWGCAPWNVLCLMGQIDFAACAAAGAVYASAVSYLGDGVIELAPLVSLLQPLLGPMGAGQVSAQLLAAQLAAANAGIEIEAAYPCPCACMTCPPDEALSEPACHPSVLRGAFVTQDVLRYEKQAHNVSGVGPVCECVSSEVTVETACPAGAACDADERVCATDVCDPIRCNQAELVSRCEQGLFSLYSTVVTEWAVSACQAVDEYRSACVTTNELLGSVTCLGWCAAGDTSCVNPQLGSARLRVMEPEDRTSASYLPCPGCRIQLEGAAGTFEGITDGNGVAHLTGLPKGPYVIRYGCGRYSLGPHLPSDLVLNSWATDSWELARRPLLSAQVPAPVVAVPTSGAVDVLTGACGPDPVCSASDLSPVPTDQAGLPEEVASTRRQIIEAAVACDYDALTELASWPYFAHGGPQEGGSGAYWRSLEESYTGQPLFYLVQTLNLPFAVVEVEGDVNYVWPAAWAEERWSQIPAEQQTALTYLYGPGLRESWSLGRAFSMYYTSIGFDGLWTVFLAGQR